MNKIKSLALVCAMLCGVTASAQFTTGGSNSSSKSTVAQIEDYNQLGISYVNEAFSYDFPKSYGDMDNIGMNGIGVKYIHGFSVSSTLPMYVETGLNFNFCFGSQDSEDDYDDSQYKYQHAALAVPVNFAYKFNINDNVAIKPYLGLNFKYNVLGRTKYEEDDDDDYGYYDNDSKSKWESLYDKKDMGGKDYVWNRFQMGWHIGAELQVNKFFFGLNYGTDFIKAYSYKKMKINSATLNVSLGLCF